FQYILSLSWHYPILLPLLEKIDATSDYYDKEAVTAKLNGILETNALHRRSDGMCWSLYYLKQLGSHPTTENIELVIQTGDATAIALLSIFESATDAVVAYARQVIENCTLY
ncbi:reverse transcriptase, partial [Pseudomonas sp. P7548]|nr:reverse transcriptase [Pseudomonas sp. P7548]